MMMLFSGPTMHSEQHGVDVDSVTSTVQMIDSRNGFLRLLSPRELRSWRRGDDADMGEITNGSSCAVRIE